MARTTAVRKKALAMIVRGLRDGLRGAEPGAPVFLTIGQDIARELLAALVEAQAIEDASTPTASGTMPPLSARAARVLLEMFGGEHHQSPPKS